VTALDWVILVLWLGVALSGFWKGAIRIVFGVGGFVAGVWLAVAVGPGLEGRLQGVVGADWLAVVLARALPLLACVALAVLAGWGIERTLRAMKLGWLNRVAGAALAGLLAALLMGVLLATAAGLSPAWTGYCRRSVLAPKLIALVGLAGTVTAPPPPDSASGR